jgi:hypothetical protein
MLTKKFRCYYLIPLSIQLPHNWCWMFSLLTFSTPSICYHRVVNSVKQTEFPSCPSVHSKFRSCNYPLFYNFLTQLDFSIYHNILHILMAINPTCFLQNTIYSLSPPPSLSRTRAHTHTHKSMEEQYEVSNKLSTFRINVSRNSVRLC